MNGSHEAPGSPPGRGVADPAEEPSIRAARLFAGLTGEPQPANGAARSFAAPQPDAGVSTGGQGASPSEPRPPVEGEVLDFLVSARNAIERTARAVKAVRTRAKNTAGDLADLGEAVEEALDATNERLMQIERLVFGEAAPVNERHDLAMSALRSAVRRSAQRADDGGATPTAQ